jgi:histone H2B
MQTNNQRSFSTYIYKVLKRVHSNKGMSTPALESLDSCMRIIANKLGEHARNFAITENLKTVNTREVEGAVKSLLPLTLSNNAITFATAAVSKFYETHDKDKVNDNSQSKSEPKQTREFRAGLVFSVSFSILVLFFLLTLIFDKIISFSSPLSSY